MRRATPSVLSSAAALLDGFFEHPAGTFSRSNTSFLQHFMGLSYHYRPYSHVDDMKNILRRLSGSCGSPTTKKVSVWCCYEQARDPKLFRSEGLLCERHS